MVHIEQNEKNEEAECVYVGVRTHANCFCSIGHSPAAEPVLGHQ